MTLARREFIAVGAAALAAGCSRAVRGGAVPAGEERTGPTPARATEPDRLPIAFSTLGCPAWSWREVLDFAAAHQYAAVELRGLAGEMDLTRRPEFAPGRIADTRRDLAGHALRVACVGSSATMHLAEGPAREAQLDEGRRYIDLAHALGAPNVRVFGNNWVPGEPREATLARVAAGLRALGAHARDSGVTVLLESHGDFTDSATLLEVMRRTDAPGVAILWDAHHTFVSGHEDPADTARQIMPYVRHVHLKDSVPVAGSATDRHYVLTGTGTVPVRQQFAALAAHRYRGVYGFEWEKRWHPEIEAPEVAFAQYVGAAREYLHAAGVR